MVLINMIDVDYIMSLIDWNQSSEKQKNKNGLGTNSYLPAVAGLLITIEVINQVCDNNYRKK